MKLGRLPEMIFTLIVFVLIIQLALGAIQPYLGWIGRTFAIVVILLMLGAAVAGLVTLIRWLSNRSDDGGDTFNG